MRGHIVIRVPLDISDRRITAGRLLFSCLNTTRRATDSGLVQVSASDLTKWALGEQL